MTENKDQEVSVRSSGNNAGADKESGAGRHVAAKASGRRRGFLGRLLDRLAKANEREFGSGGPCCH